MPGDNVNKQAGQQGSGDREQSDRIRKDGPICVPNADWVKMKDRDGNVMETAVNTTPGHEGTKDFLAPTSVGGYIGRLSNPEDFGRLIQRIQSEKGCTEVRYKVIPNKDEDISKFEKTAVEKRVISNHDWPEAGTFELD
ncbi:hypothetical protein FIE12Z_5428 [Fusarium flagelliforme]|uniref:Uncharacterized protein n=1 Tax=Fusarium flagelliforme TaxID=2675880 RepID=A0A395MSV5_9HYPO|nr:hypothetical protein FIE12Z_5428 [Fusarium flagelliforme]